jgi:hypothetical protein
VTAPKPKRKKKRKEKSKKSTKKNSGNRLGKLESTNFSIQLMQALASQMAQ